MRDWRAPSLHHKNNLGEWETTSPLFSMWPRRGKGGEGGLLELSAKPTTWRGTYRGPREIDFPFLFGISGFPHKVTHKVAVLRVLWAETA